MNFRELLDSCKAHAMKDALLPSEESVFKSICRAYSAAFATPLAHVYTLNPQHVITEAFAAQLDDLNIEENLEELYEQLCILEDPEYDAKKEADLQNWIKDIEEQEQDRVKKGISVFQDNHKKKLPKKTSESKVKPIKRTVDFSNLDENNEK